MRRTAAVLTAVVACTGFGMEAQAVSLGAAESFGVLGGEGVTNTGPTFIDGDLGVYPGSSITGFSVGNGTYSGSLHQTDAVAQQAQADARTAYDVLAGMSSTQTLTGQNLGNRSLVPGVYTYASDALLTGQLTLDGANQTNPLFVFQIGTALTTESASSILLINGAQACDIFWQIGSAATLGSTTEFYGTVLADTEAITLGDGASVDGRLIALTAAVTLINNVITVPDCDDEDGNGGSISTPVPEPASAALLVMGLTSLLLPIRRRSKTVA